MSMFRRLVLLASLVSVDAGADSGPQPLISIVNGSPTTEYSAVIAILHQSIPRCTGTLVTKRVVVTAAHCLTAARLMSVYIGNGKDVERGVTIKVSDARRFPGYDPETLENDIALLLLEREAPVTPLPIFAGLWEDSFIGRTVNVVGFGSTGPGTHGGHIKRLGTTRLESYDDTSLTFLPSPSQTCVGDSGGPAFLSIDGSEVLVGVTSFGDAACTEYGTDIRVDRYASDFIGPYIAAQSRGNRPIGEPCRADDQCIERRCEVASSDLPARYCTRSCDRSDQCPGEMICGTELDHPICVYPDGGPAANGAACRRNEDCDSGVCAGFSEGSIGECASWCAYSVEATACEPTQSCRPNVRDAGTFVCGPPVTYYAGCTTTTRVDRSWLLLLFVFLSVAGFWTRRGAKRGRAAALDCRREPASAGEPPVITHGYARHSECNDHSHQEESS